jgi:DNA-binding NarL/FixJ family response regulator
MLERPRAAGPLDRLSERERAVLAAMAEGLSNREIAEALDVSERAVSRHVTSLFAKLGLPPDADGHRRVLAVLTYLHNAG